MSFLKIRRIILLGICLVCFGVPFKTEAADDAIIAVVNNEIITLKDFKEYLNAMYMQMMAEGRTQEEIQKTMADYEINGIEQLIEDKLLVDEANRKQMEIRPKAIDERLEKIKGNYPSEKDFLEALAGEGLTVTDLRNKVTDQLKAKYVVDMEVRQKIYVNPQDVTDYFDKNFKDFQEPEKVDLDSIFIAYNDKRDAAEKKAAEAADQLKKGTSFTEVSKKYSDAPSIGMIARGQFLPALEKSIFKLNEGETSTLITTNSGIYIFHIKKKIPAKNAVLEEVNDEIYNRIFSQKFHDRLKEWLGKLRSQAYVEIKK